MASSRGGARLFQRETSNSERAARGAAIGAAAKRAVHVDATNEQPLLTHLPSRDDPARRPAPNGPVVVTQKENRRAKKKPGHGPLGLPSQPAASRSG
ncbi:hypothetical protein MRX96_000880 [Rhipicephalus microplus]